MSFRWRWSTGGRRSPPPKKNLIVWFAWRSWEARWPRRANGPAAEDAWTVVAHESRETYYQIYAWDALAYLAAQRGDESGFELRAARCDALGWENGQRTAAAEILYYRGLSYRALGRWKEASEWLTRAVRFAEDAGLNRSFFLAEEALKSLDTPERIPAPAPAIATSAALRIGLKEMRAEAVGTEA